LERHRVARRGKLRDAPLQLLRCARLAARHRLHARRLEKRARLARVSARASARVSGSVLGEKVWG